MTARAHFIAEDLRGAWAEYEKATASARADFKKATASAWDEYKKVRDAAWDEYKKVRDAAPVVALTHDDAEAAV